MHAERPLHPRRFREALSELAASCTCLRGRLWVASALSERVAIGGAGPRIWMENTGSWSTEIAASELMLYGSEHEAGQIAKIFENCQVTEDELQDLLTTAPAPGNNPDLQGGE
ncbi:GTP-binding protein [Glutamicibacter halophytocola]|uniref:GTP-binding protein n=1 Tax=Glutamicibacter halophytocola TaxID=1933880 RepID=UPI00321C2ED5